ncbi:MAG TPA: rhomboid family intramembrane serine protease [Bacteroidales bacterium]|nr:rhomboid family intramembrane serine protease [Bacteroidales bacterium]
MSMVNEIKSSLRKGNIIYRLIFINVAVFVVLGVWFVILRLFTPGISLTSLKISFNETVLKYLMVPSIPGELLTRPWTVITYMFTHFNLWHIVFNMLVLYWFGRIFMQYLTGKQLLSTYLLGGLAGSILYIAFINGFPGLREYLGGSMLGASAAIMAVVVAISFYVPNYTLYMFFIGPVRLKYIAIAFVIIDILMIASDNAGGNIAHLGGALYGYWFMSGLKKGRDIGGWLNIFLDKAVDLFKPRPKLNVAYRKSKQVTDEDYNRRKISQQKEVDRILDKIAKGGYESLSKSEKETLFKMSNKN